jgi:hypothetical protein
MGTTNRQWALPTELLDSYRTNKKLSKYRSTIATGLQLSDHQQQTSESPIDIGLTEIYRTKWEIFTIFDLSPQSFAVLATFSRISAQTHYAVGAPADTNTEA